MRWVSVSVYPLVAVVICALGLLRILSHVKENNPDIVNGITGSHGETVQRLIATKLEVKLNHELSGIKHCIIIKYIVHLQLDEREFV